jgi:SAM-dependent methyltransferase
MKPLKEDFEMTNKKSDKSMFDFDAVFEPDDYLYFYEDWLTEERTRKETEFLAKELELDTPMKILDLACGYGRHANRLAELGHNVTGVDITKGFLKIAKDDAKKKGVSIEYIQKDMREITFKEEFDRVLLLFTSFGFFEDEDNLKVLKNVASALKLGGLFCFDTFNRDVFLKAFLPYIVVEKGDDLMIDRNIFDSATGRIYNKRIVIRNGKRKDKPFFIRLYNPTEIRDLLSRAGMKISKIYSGWDAKPFTSDSRRMIIIAKREGGKYI